MNLKTLKDIAKEEMMSEGDVERLKAEAVKWVKDFEERVSKRLHWGLIGAHEEFINFFDITESDLEEKNNYSPQINSNNTKTFRTADILKKIEEKLIKEFKKSQEDCTWVECDFGKPNHDWERIIKKIFQEELKNG